ncbi:Fic/DOC family [Popillia japonica]|uniref:Fic/DOC family n=1 Tax=Popillia japonica TaxID=7064 RepID=A0AAW1KQ96_POPJA
MGSSKKIFQIVNRFFRDCAKSVFETMSDFEEHPYWRAAHADNISTLLPRIKKFNKAIRKFAGKPENVYFVQGCIDQHREFFITEFNRVESKDAADADVSEKQALKRRNVTKAIDDLFGNVLVTDSLRLRFDVDLAKKINETIGKDLITDAGVYREFDAQPGCYGFTYLDPKKIKPCLKKLFEDIKEPIKPDRDDWYNVATEFLNRFLFTHPFRNGNGRVARILLSALLIHYSIVPLCFFLVARILLSALLIHYSIVPLCFFLWKCGSNGIYLYVLAEAHNPLTRNDKLLKSFIIEVVHSTLEQCVKDLDLTIP